MHAADDLRRGTIGPVSMQGGIAEHRRPLEIPRQA